MLSSSFCSTCTGGRCQVKIVGIPASQRHYKRAALLVRLPSRAVSETAPHPVSKQRPSNNILVAAQELGCTPEQLQLALTPYMDNTSPLPLDSSISLSNLQLLREYISDRDALAHLCTTRAPWLLLSQELSSWVSFLQHYGLPHGHQEYLLLSSPQLYLSSDIFRAGQALMFLQSLGLDQQEIIDQVILQCPGILCMDVEGDLQPRVDTLRLMGMDDMSIRTAIYDEPLLLVMDMEHLATMSLGG